MADRSLIEWTDTTWNPITGCSVVSPGCTNCYAMKLAGTRMRRHPSRQGLTRDSKAGPVWTGDVRLNEEWLDQPLRWTRQRRIFVCAHGDLFHEAVPDAWIDRVFAVMALAPQHQFQVLTKRTDRLRRYLGAPGSAETAARYAAIKAAVRDLGREMPSNFWFMQHIWLGFSAEDQSRFDARWDDMKHVSSFGPRWASLEPLLAPIDLKVSQDWCDLCGGTGLLARWPKGRCHTCHGKGRVSIMGPPEKNFYPRLDWVVVGGESGPGARPMHPDWARSLRDQCAAARVPFLFKQWGEWAPIDAWAPADRRPQRAIDAQGDPVDDDVAPEDVGGCRLTRLGKKAAGRLLDGVLHDAFPAASA